MKSSKYNTHLRRIAVTALMAALGCVLMLLDFPLPFLIPSFVKFDFSEVPAIIATYMFGPIDGILVCLLKNVLSLTHTSTGGIGELANFLLGCTLVIPAGFVFRKLKTPKSLLIGGLVGALAMGLLSVPINYYLTYPIYRKFMPLEQIIKAYQKLIPSVDGLAACLFVFNAPFTFVKGVVSVLIAFLMGTKLKFKEIQNSLKDV